MSHRAFTPRIDALPGRPVPAAPRHREDADLPDVQEQQEPQEQPRRTLVLVLTGLVLSVLLAALDQTIVATALPTIVGDLNGLEHLSWVVTAYILAATIGLPVYGKLGDLFGRKSIFIFAIAVFLAGSVLSGLAQNMGQLIGFRALQGIGGGGLMIGAQAILGDLVSPRDRGKYMGLIGAAFGLASGLPIPGPGGGCSTSTCPSVRWRSPSSSPPCTCPSRRAGGQNWTMPVRRCWRSPAPPWSC